MDNVLDNINGKNLFYLLSEKYYHSLYDDKINTNDVTCLREK